MFEGDNIHFNKSGSLAHLVNLLNRILTQGIFPEHRNTFTLSVIHKSKDINDKISLDLCITDKVDVFPCSGNIP